MRQCAGRILRSEVQAERDNPPFDRVCMDGIAVAGASVQGGTRRLRMQGTQAAGATPLALSGPDAAIEVMTGAVMPLGTDSVIPLEEYDVAGAVISLHDAASAEAWRNVQRRGSDSAPGVPMLTAGTRLGAAEVAVLASAGLAQARVSRLPRVMVVSTGDELVEPGLPIADHQVRRSNAYGVSSALALHGFVAVGDAHLRDDEALMRRRLGEILESHDVLVLSGGVSKGKFDFVPAALKALGVEEVFYQVAQRPGRPMWFGTGRNGQLVFGLPGNPVSTLICVLRYVLPALRAASAQRTPLQERIALGEQLTGRKMTYFMPVALEHDGPRPPVAHARLPNGSGDFLALAGTDGFIELPPQPDGYAQGFVGDFYRW